MKKIKNKRKVFIFTNLLVISTPFLSLGMSINKTKPQEKYESIEVKKNLIIPSLNSVAPKNNSIPRLNHDDYKIDYDTNKLIFKTPPKGYSFKFLYADLEQVIDDNQNIYRPLEDKEVEFTYALIKNNDPVFLLESSPQKITVKATQVQEENKNKKPNLIPQISEWYSNIDENTENSSLKLKSIPTLYISGLSSSNQLEFKDFSETFKQLFKNLTGKDLIISIVENNIMKKTTGDFIFDFSKNNIPGYDKETYGISIDDNVHVTVTGLNGAVFAAQTIMQMIKIQNQKFTDIKITKGKIKDYPKYKLRGFSLDVAKKPFTIKTLKNIIRQLSWYKQNELELNLSDNAAHLWEIIGEPTNENLENGFKGYSGFRLESDVENEGKKLTSQDFSYSKKEFKELIYFAKNLGIRIVPKFNLSSGALSITKLFKDIALKMYKDNQNLGKVPLIENIDFTKSTIYKGKKVTAAELIKLILEEYIEGHEALFGKDSQIPINISGKDFEGDDKSFNMFLETMFEYFHKNGITLRLIENDFLINNRNLSSKLSEFIKQTEVVLNPENHTIAKNLHKKGYKIINVDYDTTVVPGRPTFKTLRGSLAEEDIFRLDPDEIDRFKFPPGSKQYLGMLFDVKLNNNSGTITAGLTEYEIYKVILKSLPYHSRNLWGKSNEELNAFKNNISNVGVDQFSDGFTHKLQENRKEYFRFDFDESTKDDQLFDKRGIYGLISNLKNAETKEDNNGKENIKSLELKGGDSNAKFPVGVLGFNNSLNFKIKRMQTSPTQDEEIIFSANSEYGDFAIKAKQKNSQKFGFSREGIDYTFDYEMPYDKWEEIELRNVYEKESANFGTVELYVNSKKVEGLVGKATKDNEVYKRADGSDVVVDNSTSETSKILLFPLEQIGHNKNSFKGNITNIIGEPLNNMFELEKKSDDYIILEGSTLNFNVEKVGGVGDITADKIKVNTMQAEKIKIEETKLKIIKNVHSHVIMSVTLSLVNNPNQKFTREYYVPIDSLISKFQKEILDLKKNSDPEKHPQMLITEFEEELDNFSNSVSMLQTANEEQINKLRPKLNEITKILKTFKDSLDDIITKYKKLNPDFYLTNSFKEFKKVYEEIEPKAATVNKNNYSEFFNKLKTAKEMLISNKSHLLKSIENILSKINTDLHTADSIEKHKKSVNEIKIDINNLNDVSSSQLVNFDMKLKSVSKLITFNQELENFIKNVEKEIDIKKFNQNSVEDYVKTLQTAKDAITSGLMIKKQEYEVLIKNINDAKDILLKNSKLSAGAIAAIVITVIIVISGGLGLIWFYRKKIHFIKRKS